EELAPQLIPTAFVVVTVVVTAELGIGIERANFGRSETYTARFKDATRLQEGDDVRIAGVSVGSVSDVSVVDRRLARVDFEVETGIEIPQNVHAAVKYL